MKYISNNHWVEHSMKDISNNSWIEHYDHNYNYYLKKEIKLNNKKHLKLAIRFLNLSIEFNATKIKEKHCLYVDRKNDASNY